MRLCRALGPPQGVFEARAQVAHLYEGPVCHLQGTGSEPLEHRAPSRDHYSGELIEIIEWNQLG